MKILSVFTHPNVVPTRKTYVWFKVFSSLDKVKIEPL